MICLNLNPPPMSCNPKKTRTQKMIAMFRVGPYQLQMEL